MLDQVPEYKLFSTNIPPIHNLFFANNENGQQSHRPLINGTDHDVREIEKRLMGNESLFFPILHLIYVLFFL